MQLRRLKVRNIRSYETGEVEFSPGTTLLAGDVGAGKTSLLYAIEMALFGVAEVDAAYLVRHGSGHAETEVEFEDAEHRYSIARRFRRVHRKGKETFEPERISFRVDGAETTYSATELRQRVIELLGFPDNPNPQAHSDLWRWAVYVPQERMRDILEARAQDRLETVRKALGVERYRTAAENAGELAADLRRSQRTRQGEAERMRHFDVEYAEASTEIDRWTLESHRIQETIRQRETVVEAARTDLTRAEEAVRRVEVDRAALEGLEKEQAEDRRRTDEIDRTRFERLRARDERQRAIAGAVAEAGELASRRAALAEAEARGKAARSARDEMEGTLHRLTEARAERTAADRRWQEAGDALAAAERDRSERARDVETTAGEGPAREPPAPTERSLVEIDRDLSAARDVETRALGALAQSRSALGELEALLEAGVCPRCHQPVRAEAFEGHRAESRADTDRREADATQATTRRQALEAERRSRERYERAHDRWREVEKRRALARAALDRAENQRSEAASRQELARKAREGSVAQVEALAGAEAEAERRRRLLEESEREQRELRAALEGSIAAAERVRSSTDAVGALEEEVARLEAERTRTEERIASRGDRLGELGRSLEGSEATLRHRARAESAHSEARTALESERVVAARLEARVEEAARRLRVAEQGRKERASLLEEVDDLGRKAEWVAEPFRTALLTMEQKLLAHAQAAFEGHFARYFASLVDDPALVARTDVAFTPAVAIEGEWTPAEALSGGERTSLALAFRLALAEVVRSFGSLRLDTILLDEPTDGFSPEQVVRMGELLDELGLPQVIIVSHEAGLGAIADRVVRITKEEGRSVLTGSSGGASGAPPATESRTPPAPSRRRTRTRPLTGAEPSGAHAGRAELRPSGQ